MISSNPSLGLISKFIESIKAKQSPTTLGDRKQTSDFISVYDILELIDLVIQKRKL
ncbi:MULTISPECIES: NAD-dependent epimerase/dehydratase family protein [Methanohalophilus]|uniref:NAD-dependent epimerase/dehydratase family protein n=1 Tax=Methanohalophilus euhalobius TaxID=51203 RepID=A0A3M9L7Z1_9EURY|nr:NAD-dependent epimerase/dehydratase family protein [Methanohalophilus euhalobius]